MLEGRLGDFTLPDILRLLAFTAKSGRLWVQDDRTRGRIEVLGGRVRDASVDAARLGLARRLLGLDLVEPEAIAAAVGDAETLPTDLDLARRLIETEAVAPEQLAELVREQALDAVFELLRWEDGGFAFEAVTPTTRGPSSLDLAVSVDELLDEATRRLEAHDAVRERTGPGSAVVSIRRPGRERAEVALTPEGWTLLALVDGRRTVDDIVTLCGQGDYRTRRTLAGLLDEGVVAIGDAESAAPGERLLAANETVAAIEARLAPATPPGAAVPEAPTPAPAPTETTAPTDAARPAEAPATPTAEAPAEQAPPAPSVDAEPAEESTVPAAGQDAEPTSPPAAAQPAAGTDSAESPAPSSPPASSSWVRELEARDAEPEPWDAADRAASDQADAARVELDAVEITSDADEQRVTPLRAKVRADRLRTDPEIDEDLVQRLIDGVEGL